MHDSVAELMLWATFALTAWTLFPEVDGQVIEVQKFKHDDPTQIKYWYQNRWHIVYRDEVKLQGCWKLVDRDYKMGCVFDQKTGQYVAIVARGPNRLLTMTVNSCTENTQLLLSSVTLMNWGPGTEDATGESIEIITTDQKCTMAVVVLHRQDYAVEDKFEECCSWWTRWYYKSSNCKGDDNGWKIKHESYLSVCFKD